jgi:uncharacterized cupin superfamily protein
VVAESQLVPTDRGLVPRGDGWFVLNARETQWFERPGRGVLCEFEGADLEGGSDFDQLGINLTRLAPGEPMSMYHWEADQEDFLALAGEAMLIIEGEERPLRAWDFVHCPAGTDHTIVAAGTAPCLVLAMGGRARSRGEDWGGLHGQRHRDPSRRRSRAGDPRTGRGVRAVPAGQADRLSRRLAPRLTSRRPPRTRVLSDRIASPRTIRRSAAPYSVSQGRLRRKE